MLSRRQRIHVVEQAHARLENAVLHCAGPWTAASLVDVERALRSVRWPAGPVELDFAAISAMDIAGAWVMHRTRSELRAQGREVRVSGLDADQQRLLDLIAERSGEPQPVPHLSEPGFLEDIGRTSSTLAHDFLRF